MKRKSVLFVSVLSIVAGLIFFTPFFTQITTVAAQSTGDTLPTRTQTPSPTHKASASPTPTATPVRLVWHARLVSNTLGATEGHGSIFRVSVQGLKGTPIELRSDDQLIVANSGSKPEYGECAAEFAPVTKGVWTVSVPALGISLDVPADNYNLAVIEFVQIPETEATQISQPSATATPLGAVNWLGHQVSETPGAGVPFGRLLVQVVGRNAQPVQLATLQQVVNTAFTGQKPHELGPNTVEFTGLTPGTYIVTPLGLNTSYRVELKPNIETRLQFRAIPATVTSTPTVINTPYRPPSPTNTPTSTPTPSITPTPTKTPMPSQTPLPTNTSLPTFTTTPQPSPTPVTGWLGTIESRSQTSTKSSITVRVVGIEGLPLRLSSDNSQHRCVTGLDGYGQDACMFSSLESGHYIVAPEGMGVELPIKLFSNEAVRINFEVDMLPPGITGWQARLNSNSNSFHAWPRFNSTLRARVLGKEGQVIVLHPVSLPHATRYCEVIYNPILGDLVCEFGQIGPGAYHVEALNTNASLNLFIDGIGEAEVEFAPNATNVGVPANRVIGLVGQGAQPDLPTATPSPTATKRISIRPTPTTTPSVTPSPTPVFAWQGRVLESTYVGGGVIGVRAAGLKDHPVVIRSGGWQSPTQMTGTKEELGQYAAEFGGLAPGEYIVQLVDLAEIKVNLQPGEFILVEFKYDFVIQ